MATLDVFVGNFTIIDFELYDLWLNGLSDVDAAHVLQKGELQHCPWVTIEDIVSEVHDHYRLFNHLEKILKNPTHLADQQIHQIDAEAQTLLIEKYYQFDEVVIREIIGKKLSGRNRKDLDDVSEKTRRSIKKCRRQFDNLKRVFKTVEEMLGSLVDNIKTHYQISADLARKYAALVFIANNRFETGKKKLSQYSLLTFIKCANQMITNWSYSADECKSHRDMDVDLDRKFLQDLRDLKPLLEKESIEEHRSFVLQALRSSISRRALQDLEDNFKNISKSIINIAMGLNHSREVRDIFIDIYEKIVEPCQQARWSREDLQSFVTAYQATAKDMEYMKYQPLLQVVWDRYMNTMSSCILELFPS
ncbi:acidic fibroblast growth factor intracellular-binding protein-like [Mytilus trossulus]|uniref:acidic fibroblast growth factor intracellular-binding protein-like n=1 Tax=Mytilus trossulus TaxID=6551 RepID=UPI003004C963